MTAVALLMGPLAILAAAGARCAPAPPQPRVAIFAPGGSERATVRVEIADDEKDRERGLMFRQHLDEDAGMIFVFSASQVVYFWMKNTRIPLDMIFADQDGKVVGIVAEAKPYSLQSVGPGLPAQYVLEVNGGFCQRHGVMVGDWLRFSGFTPHARDQVGSP
jgi:uncharacterized protein